MAQDAKFSLNFFRGGKFDTYYETHDQSPGTPTLKEERTPSKWEMASKFAVGGLCALISLFWIGGDGVEIKRGFRQSTAIHCPKCNVLLMRSKTHCQNCGADWQKEGAVKAE